MLRVLTLNIWNVMGDWRARRKDIVAWIDHLEPHVVCLQEVIESPDGKNQAEWIAEHTAGDWHIAFAGREVMDGAATFGNAVMSRWPIDAQNDRDLTSNPPGRIDEVQRLVLHARTHGYDVFNTHLVWRYDEGNVREKEVVELDDVVTRVGRSRRRAATDSRRRLQRRARQHRDPLPHRLDDDRRQEHVLPRRVASRRRPR